MSVIERGLISITCVIFANKVGGMERVLAILVENWTRKGYDVRIVETDGKTQSAFYNIGDNVRQVRLDLGGVSSNPIAAVVNNIRRIVSLRGVLRDSDTDVVLSFSTEQSIVTILAALGTGVPVLVSEHTDPYTARKPLVWRVLRWITYRWADRVVVLNERARGYFSGTAQTEVIPNPVVVPKCNEKDERMALIVGLGRLVKSKRFDVLVAAFGDIVLSHPNWKLAIIGDGYERRRLEEEAERLNVADRVDFLGSVVHPEMELRQAAIFVSCSELEGFPMALCEAMAAGLPVVAAKYNESVEELVEDEWNGLLIPTGDVEATSRAIVRLIEDDALRKHLGKNARASMRCFQPDKVLDLWDRLFERVGVGGHTANQP